MTERILPLPYLPTYIARRPSNTKIRAENFNPIYATNWQKALDNYAVKHREFDGFSNLNIDVDSIYTEPKQYDTYKQSFHLGSDRSSIEYSLNQVRPITVPNHITRTSEKWSRFLDEYPDRFKINYPSPDDDNDLYYPSRPGRYPYQMNKESPNFYSGLISRIQPVSNPFRQSESRQKSTVTHPIWIPYGTAYRRYQKPQEK